MALVVPVLAATYDPGVSVGEYVKYESHVVGGPDILNWTKDEVITVSGKEVTLRSSGQFKNGTSSPGSGRALRYNVETGKMNGTTDYTYGPIIASNLTEGDSIPPLSSQLKVNKTETRTYLGNSRSVNILNTSYSDQNYANRWTIIYDRVSGMMLEMRFDYTVKKPTPTTTTQTLTVIDTNIFGQVIPEFPSGILLFLASLTVPALLLGRRRLPRYGRNQVLT